MIAGAAAANSNGGPDDRRRRRLLFLRTTKTWENFHDQPFEDEPYMNMMDPITVRQTDVSFKVRFHYIYDGDMKIAVELANFKSSVDDLLIKSTLKVFYPVQAMSDNPQRFDATLTEADLTGSVSRRLLGVALYDTPVKFLVQLDVSAPEQLWACALGAELLRTLTDGGDDGPGPRRTFYDADVKLESADEGELSAHKHVLSARSPFFKKMLTGDMREARESRVALMDLSGNLLPGWLLKSFRKFLYTGMLSEVGGGLDMALELMALGHRYLVGGLVAECTRMLWRHLDKGSALELLSLLPQQPWVKRADAEALARKARKLVFAHWDEVTSSDSWAVFARDQPENALLLAEARLVYESTTTDSDSSDSE